MEHIKHIWPNMTDLAADLGMPYTTVASWKARGRIPADYDADIIRAARDRGETLTFEDMAVARLSRRSPDPGASSVDGAA